MSQVLACDLRGISRRFGRRWALRGVTMQAHSGEVVGVMGHNGSGKSTLLRVLATVIKPTLGAATVLGVDLVRDAAAVRGKLGFLAHSPGLYEDLTAAENLRFAARMLGVSESPLGDILERVGLSGARDERVRGYSAGMLRRLALGRVLLMQPMLLLLDEPYNNFDAQGVELVNEVIRDTSARGGTTLLVLHDRRQAASLMDRVVELAQGAVVPTASEVEDVGPGSPKLRVASGGGA